MGFDVPGMQAFDDWASGVVTEFSEQHPAVVMNWEQWGDLVDLIAVRLAQVITKCHTEAEVADG